MNAGSRRREAPYHRRPFGALFLSRTTCVILFCSSLNVNSREILPSATNDRSNVFSVLDRSKDSTGHHDSNELTGTTTTTTAGKDRCRETLARRCFCGGENIVDRRDARVESWLFNSKWHSSFRFRFPHVLRVQEDVQVADGVEPARAGGMRQDFVHLPVLSQRHADEVQSIESPQEGARLRH